MSDVNAEGATNAPQDATNADAPATQDQPADVGNAAGGVSGSEQSPGETSAPDASGSNAGEAGNAPAGDAADAGNSSGTGADSDSTQSSGVVDSAEGAVDAGNAASADTGAPNSDAAAAADPNASAGADPANPSSAQSTDSGASTSAGSLLVEIESLALRAYQAGMTEEHNLMAWLHSHLTGAQNIVHGSDQLVLSDEARAVVAKVKGLL